jgi:hypothetical protein
MRWQRNYGGLRCLHEHPFPETITFNVFKLSLG